MTGGSGFIGSHLVDELVNKYETYIFDNHLPGFGNKTTNPKAKLITGDVRRYEDIEFAMKNIDVVIHLAALSHVSTCLQNPKLCYDINTGGTINILECARKNNTEKVIIAASDHIYGKLPDYLPVDEVHPLKALNESDPYGQSKAMQAILSKMYYKTYGLQTIITASGNVFSERQSAPNVIPNFIKAALNNQNLIIHGTGNQTREMYHISNLTEGYIKLIETPNLGGELFNFGADNEMSINEIAQKVLELIPKSKSKIKYINDIKYNAMDRMAVDIKKAQKMLNYKVKVNFEDGLKKTIEAYRRMT